MRAYWHVDVFTRAPFSGNGLTVFPESDGLSAAQMQLVTQEMRQFESIFFAATEDTHEVVARVFTVEEELDFAGHPVLGAACVLHERLSGAGERETWRIQLNRSVAPVTTVRHEGWYSATMEQDAPVFGKIASPDQCAEYATALSLTPDDLDEALSVHASRIPPSRSCWGGSARSSSTSSIRRRARGAPGITPDLSRMWRRVAPRVRPPHILSAMALRIWRLKLSWLRGASSGGQARSRRGS
jgi:hypothetical protein